MKKTRMTTKALSMLLTVIMLFTTISVGIIVPDAKVNADAATAGDTYTISASSAVSDLNAAITAANNAGADVITTIKLGGNITLSGSTASFTELKTANVLFDLNGFSFEMTNSKSGGYDNAQTDIQLPSANQGSTFNAVDVFTNGMFIIRSGATMQIINSNSSASGMLKVYTDMADTQKEESTDHQTSSSLIYSEGTLIVGDTNTANNNFTLYAHSSCRNTNGNNPNLYGKKSATANCYTVTINGSSAVFKMYGGKIEATGSARARRGTYADIICYALNVNACNSAEIYGGSINIPRHPSIEQNNGIFQATSKACEGGTARISAIRCNSPYLYIFNLTSSVTTKTGTDSSNSNNQYTSCIYTTEEKNAPYIYGAKLDYSVEKGDNNSTANNHGYIVRGAYKQASGGVLTPDAITGTDHTSVSAGQGKTESRSAVFYSLIVTDAENVADNGIDIFSYPTFRRFLAQYNATNDAYYGDTSITTNSTSVPSAGKYFRNGYKHTGWTGKTHPGGALLYSNVSDAGITSAGGTLFLAPTWELNKYTITYVENPDIHSDVAPTDHSNCLTSYKITDTAALTAPTNPAYDFTGWTVVDYKPLDIDTDKNAWNSQYSLSDTDKVTGKTGNVTLMANWVPKNFTATFNLGSGSAGGSSTYLMTYDIAGEFFFPDSVTPPTHYTTPAKYTVSDKVGTWNDDTVSFVGGSSFPEKSYGNVTFSTEYTPVIYTITYVDEYDNFISTQTYDFANDFTLESHSKDGYVFKNWEVVSTTGNWSRATAYTGTISKGTLYGDVTLRRVLEVETYTVTVQIDESIGEVYTSDLSYDYFYDKALQIPGYPTRNGYRFLGWVVVSATDNGHQKKWVVGETFPGTIDPGYYDRVITLPMQRVGSVTIKPVWSDPVKYTATFDGAGGTASVSTIYYFVDGAIELPTATRDGYVLQGWRVVDEDGSWIKGNIYEAGKKFSNRYGNATFEAVWDEKSYTITYNPDNGILNGTTDLSTQSYDINSVKLGEPVRDGYTFAGWKVVVADGNWTKDEIYTTDATLTGKYGNVTLRATWTAKVYSITFPADSSNGVRQYTVAQTVSNLAPYTLPGYEFNHWYVTRVIGESNWSYGDKLESSFTGKYGNIEVAADLTAIEYNYYVVDLNNNVIATGTYTIKDSVPLPDYTADGYIFKHWFVKSVEDGAWVEGEYAVGDTFAGSGYGNVTFAPVMEKIGYNITFITDGGSAVPGISYNVEDAITLPVTSKTGYDFVGWEVTSTTGNWTSAAPLTGTLAKGYFGDVVLTAKWKIKTFTITWKTPAEEKTTVVEYNGTPVAPAGINTSKPADAQYTYTFAGWSPAIVPATGNVTYTAQYTEALNSYTVTWYDEDGSTMLSAGSYAYGTHPAYNGGSNPEKEVTGKFFRFVGWRNVATGEMLDTSTVVTGNASYKAVFTEVTNPATVIWVIDGTEYKTMWGGGETPSYVGIPVKADANGKKYTFSNWSPEITQVVSGGTYRYEAQFSESNQTYTAVLDLNGGAYTGDTTISYTLSAIRLPAVTKDGYTFMGWALKDKAGNWTDTENAYKAATYTGKWGNVEFTAIFEINTYTFTIVDGDYTEAKTYTTNSTAAILSLAKENFEESKEGYELTAWHVRSGEGSWLAGDTVAVDKLLTGTYGNVTVEPVWTAKVYTITWISGAVEQTVEFRYGDTVVAFTPISRPGYAAVWENADAIPSVMPAENLSFTAVYLPIEYYLRFESNGGSTVENFNYYITSTATLPIPKRDGATFKGWKVSAGNGSWVKSQVYDAGYSLTGAYGNATLTAQWEFALYEVTWVAGDTTRISYWYHGAMPSFSGTPVKSSDERYSYVFSGWDKKIVAVTGDITYTAQFDKVDRVYIIKWDIDGYIAEKYTLSLKYGEKPEYKGSEPVRASTDKYDFRFIGWTPEISEATKDITYVAQFEAIAKLQGLRIDKTALFLDIDETAYVSAVIFPTTASNDDVDWISQNESVATIDSNGKITAKSAGSAIIRVQSKDAKYKAYCVVQVAPVITEYILVSAAGVSTIRRPGDAIQLYATIMPSNATNQSIIWTSSNPAVATVDQNGFVVYGEEEGTAVITAISDGYASGTITVTTTVDESLIEDSVQTYVVMFLKSSSSYIIGGETYENINVICREGDTLEFLLTQPHFATVNATQFERDVDGVYRIKNIDRNYTVYATERADIGMEQPEEPEEEQPKETFFDKLKAFFRSIVEFFRNLFN